MVTRFERIVNRPSSVVEVQIEDLGFNPDDIVHAGRNGYRAPKSNSFRLSPSQDSLPSIATVGTQSQVYLMDHDNEIFGTISSPDGYDHGTAAGQSSVRLHLMVALPGSGNGDVEFRVRIMYRQAGEVAGAADEDFLLIAPVIDTNERITIVEIPLNELIIAERDLMSFRITRTSNVADTYGDKIGLFQHAELYLPG